MESPMKQAAKLLRDKKGGHRKLAVFLCLALLVTAGTVTAFVLNGQAQEHTRRVLECTAVHQHTESCYPDGDTSAEPVCGLADYAVHTHNDDCYDENGVLVCQLEEIEEHTHTDECYTCPLICGQQEFPAHVHTADCYADEDKVLICGEEEHEPVAAVEGHTHTDACYETPRNLVCGEQERPAVEPVEGDPGYTHTEACYDENGELICGEEERPAVEPVEGDPGHTHTDACYEYGEPVLICGLEETEPVEADPGHTHTAECYQVKEGALPVCGLEETEGHTHTEACYGEPVLTCTKPEIELHTHTDECYETRTVTVDGEEVEEKVLICDKLQVEEHTHTEECFTIVTLTPEEVEELETKAQQPDVVDLQLAYEDENVRVIVDYDSTALLPEGAAIELVKADTPAPALDPSQMVVPEVPAEPAEGETPAEPAEGETPAEPAEGETPAEPSEGETPAEPAEGETPAEPSEGETPAEPAEGETPAEPAEGETPAEPAEGETPAEPAEGETPAEPSEGEAGLVRAGFVADGREWLPASTVTYTVQYLLDGEAAGEPVQYTYIPGGELPSFAPAIAVFTQTVETDEFIVTASYTALANLPAEAELRASLITDEDAVSDYAAQYREALNSSRARMQTLLDIGFWLGEEEVQPAAPVAITVQLLGEDGLPAGAPLTVVHFGENGPEVLPANSDDKGAAAFKMHSFSPIGIGQVPESDDEGRALLNDANGVFEWADPTGLYHVTFKVNGVVAPKAAEPAEPAEGEAPDADAPEGEPAESEDEDETPSAPPAEGEAAAGEGETPDPETPDAEAGEQPAEPADIANIPLATASLLNFNVQMLGEDDEAFAAYAQLAEKNAAELLNMMVLRYTLTYGGVEMDLSGCTITIEAETTPVMVQYAENYSGNIESTLTISEDGEQEWDRAPEVPGGMVVNMAGPQDLLETPEETAGMTPEETPAAAQNGEQPAAVTSIVIGDENEQPALLSAAGRPMLRMVVAPRSAGAPAANTAQDDTFDLFATGQPNPTFTVEYRANLPVVQRDTHKQWPKDTLGSTEALKDALRNSALPVIDTSGGHLPRNGRQNPGFFLALDGSGNTGRTVLTKLDEVEVYKPRTGTYYTQPGLNYFNALKNNESYTLKTIEIVENGTVTNTVQYTDKVRFTNREQTSDKYTYIMIPDGATIRLIYDYNQKSYTQDTAFYDYNISNGYTKDGTIIRMNTAYYGINSNSNYTGNGVKYAFGNKNAGTDYGNKTWNGNLLNAGNSNGTMNCTFGLVTGTDGTNVQFASGVAGINNLFGPKAAKGKTQHKGTLTFRQEGDTYTLTTATIGSRVTSNLDQFGHPQAKHTHIWTNSFWPLDGVKPGQKEGDPHFGVKSSLPRVNGTNSTVPEADDNKNHNNYFGMSFTVNFKLAEDYIGPLEYYFFGDDDMWVFLDNSTLICDIGGVHSSVGEYVNLWDYISGGQYNHADGEHSLTFFYTERGASGSTCWMQFTLPSVTTGSTTFNDYGDLLIQKQVDKLIESGAGQSSLVENYKYDDEFLFRIDLEDNGDDFACIKHDGETGEDTESLVLHDGNYFTLKYGDWLKVSNIPAGTGYKITEIGRVVSGSNGNTVTTKPSDYVYDVIVDGRPLTPDADGNVTITGVIQKSGTVELVIHNRFHAYELPKTGGMPSVVYIGAGAVMVMLAAGVYTRRKKRQKTADTSAR